MKVFVAVFVAGMFVLTCGVPDVRSQDFDDEPPPWIERLRSVRIDYCYREMTPSDAPQAQGGIPVIVKTEKTKQGATLESYSDGSTKEFRSKSGVLIETKRDGTKIETISNDGNRIIVVLRPSGHGYIRYSDGQGSKIAPDGAITDVPGTIEVLPDGVVQQTLTDEDVILHHYPDGSTKSRPDLVTEMKAQGTWTISQSTRVTSGVPQRQILLESAILQTVQVCNQSVLGTLLTADAQTAGVPRPLAEVAVVVEERKPGLFESLAPVVIPSIGIGVGRGPRGESDRGEHHRR
jgi:hypothetical protein